MDNENVDSVILEKMGNGLQSLITKTEYQPASTDAVQGVNLNFQGEPGAIPGGQIANVSGQQVVVQPQPGVTPSYPVQNQPDPQVIVQQANQAVDHFRNLAFEATSQRIQAEEAKFEAEIAHLEPEQQEVARIKRELEQTRQVNAYTLQQREREQNASRQHALETEARQQMVAKNQHGVYVANQYGLPYSEEWVRNALLSAKDPVHMANIAGGIVQALRQQQATNVANQVNRGVFAAGGNTGNAAVGPQPREGSGDLTDLISSRGYITVAQR